MIVETVAQWVFDFVLMVVSWIPEISLPALAGFDLGPLYSLLATARFVMPTEAYAACVAMWSFVWGVRLGMVPIRWLVAWLGR